MGSQYQFKFCCGVSYHCLNCKEQFKCKKPKSKKSKEIEFKANKIASICERCNKSHWRCQDNSCTSCCKLNECNDINCLYCINNGINCKRPFPTTQKEFDLIKKQVRYLLYQIEKSNSGRLHIQFYIQFFEKMTIKRIKEIFNDDSMFIDEVKGSYENNYKYCTKEYNIKDDQGNYTKGEEARWDGDNSGPFEFGKPKNHYKKIKTNDYFSLNTEEHNEIKKVVTDLKKGRKLQELIVESCEKIPTWCNTINGLEKLNSYINSQDRSWKPIVIYMYGDPGTGKTEIAKEMFPDLFVKDMQTWWENYNGEEAILLDEFYGNFKYAELLRVLDKDKHCIQIKGSSVQLLAKYIILTSNRSPDNSYNFNEEIREGIPNQKNSEALKRRLHYVIYFKGKYSPSNNTVQISFEKGNMEDFVNGNFDILYTKKSNETFENYKLRVQELNVNNQGELIIKKEDRFDELQDVIYWRKNIIIPENVKNYIINRTNKKSNNDENSDTNKRKNSNDENSDTNNKKLKN
jgi:Putative viral replication protein/RNA helicase